MCVVFLAFIFCSSIFLANSSGMFDGTTNGLPSRAARSGALLVCWRACCGTWRSLGGTHTIPASPPLSCAQCLAFISILSLSLCVCCVHLFNSLCVLCAKNGPIRGLVTAKTWDRGSQNLVLVVQNYVGMGARRACGPPSFLFFGNGWKGAGGGGEFFLVFLFAL